MKKNLCLCMIVRNEAAIIERCLESVVGIIDTFSIVDTGSTDDTVKIIKDFFSSRGIEGNVHHSAWKNFGYNRTEAFELGKTVADYSLLIDADMVVVNKDFSKELTADCYQVKQVNGNLVYQNTRIIKNSLNWKCIGVTHEFWKADDCFNTVYLDSLEISDIGDGGSKEDKFRRDIELLTKGIEQDPTNVRYMFYLANSFRDLRMYDQAIEWYTKRIDAAGFEEEIWHAMYQRGMCRIWKRDHSLTILNDLLMAINYRRWRMEPLYQLLRYLREMEQYSIAYVLAKALWIKDFPAFDILFIEKDVYEWKMYDELCLCSYYTGNKEEARYYGSQALEANLPQVDKERITHNLTY